MDVATDFTHTLWKLTNVVELVAKAKAIFDAKKSRCKSRQTAIYLTQIGL